jgi:hypothetical protein
VDAAVDQTRLYGLFDRSLVALAARQPGIDAHQSTHLTARDVTIVRSVRVTTVARMMLDLAAVVEQCSVERVSEEAVNRELFERARWDVLRVGDDQLNGEPDGVVAVVWELLAPRLPPEPAAPAAVTRRGPSAGPKRD